MRGAADRDRYACRPRLVDRAHLVGVHPNRPTVGAPAGPPFAKSTATGGMLSRAGSSPGMPLRRSRCAASLDRLLLAILSHTAPAVASTARPPGPRSLPSPRAGCSLTSIKKRLRRPAMPRVGGRVLRHPRAPVGRGAKGRDKHGREPRRRIWRAAQAGSAGRSLAPAAAPGRRPAGLGWGDDRAGQRRTARQAGQRGQLLPGDLGRRALRGFPLLRQQPRPG